MYKAHELLSLCLKKKCMVLILPEFVLLQFFLSGRCLKLNRILCFHQNWYFYTNLMQQHVIFLTLSHIFSMQNLLFTYVISSHQFKSSLTVFKEKKCKCYVNKYFFFHFGDPYSLYLNHQQNIVISKIFWILQNILGNVLQNILLFFLKAPFKKNCDIEMKCNHLH